MTTATNFAVLLEHFFTRRLMQQRQASPHTISSYRDTFRQFLKFAEQRLHRPPSRLSLEQIDAPLIVAFLDDLEKHMTFLFRDEQGAVEWAYPVTVAQTPHRLTFSSGERVNAA